MNPFVRNIKAQGLKSQCGDNFFNLEYLNPEECPEIFWHYTGREGMLGIVNDSNIWATSMLYLNDRDEFDHCFGILEEIVNACPPESKEKAGKIFSAIAERTQTIYRYHVLVTCFSDKEDDLSQWRAYGRNSGYAFGFRREFIRKLCISSHCIMVKCEYDDNIKRQRLQLYVDNLIESSSRINASGDSDLLDQELEPYVVELLILAAMFKHESFKGESEWRMITNRIHWFNEVEFRGGSSTIVPYKRWNFPEEAKRESLEKVLIGPRSIRNLDRLATLALLYNRGYVEQEKANEEFVIETNSPYRDM